MKPQQLLVFFSYNVSLQDWKQSGILSREIRIYQELIREGFKVHFLTYGTAADLELEAELGGIQVHPLYAKKPKPSSRLGRFLDILLLPWKQRQLLQQANLYKTNQMSGAWVAVLAKWLWRKPLVVRCGYDLYRNTCQETTSWWIRSFTKQSCALAYHAATSIWVSTPQIQDQAIQDFQIAPAKFLHHPNVIDTELFSPREEERPIEPSRVLFVGRFVPEKNLYALLDAVSDSPYGIDLIGQGALEAPLKEHASKKGIDARFLGMVPNESLPGMIRKYRVFALVSHYEGQPKSLLEAMSCGLTVVGSNISGIRTIIEDGKTGLLCEPNAASIRKCIFASLETPEQQTQLGKQARQHIEKYYSLSSVLKQEKETLLTLLP